LLVGGDLNVPATVISGGLTIGATVVIARGKKQMLSSTYLYNKKFKEKLGHFELGIGHDGLGLALIF